MNGDDFFMTHQVKVLMLSTLLAVFGGLARLFMSNKQLTVYRFVSCCIVSGFTGVMASYLVQSASFSPPLQGFLVGMSGFAAPTALSAFTGMYEKKLGIKLDKARSKPKKPEVTE